MRELRAWWSRVAAHVPSDGIRSLRRAGARLPIRWRLTLLSFGLLAILLAALGTLVTLSEEHTLLANQAVALHREARLASSGLRQSSLTLARSDRLLPAAIGSISPNAQPALTYLVQHLTSPSTQVAVLATDGTPITSSSDLTGVATQALTVPPSVTVSTSAITAALAGPPADDGYIVARGINGKSQLVVLLPIVDLTTGTTVGLLQVSTPTQPIDAAVASTRLVLALGIAAALGIALALTFPLMSAGLRPLVAMERASRKIAGGALSLRLEDPVADDEIGRLARAFNSMVEQLDEAFARQKQFVADVSHELRTPLTALGGELEMLLLGADRGDAEASRRLTRGMYAEVDRMRQLVEDLLTLTRLDAGRAELHTAPTALVPLMAEIYQQAERLARGQTVTCEVASGMPLIRADADRLRQVLLNVIENALKYTPASGHVSIIARRDTPEWVAIEVRDTGAGIPPDALPHVFERFYRAEASRTRGANQSGGAGLGLSIAQSLVEAQGGRIAIASEQGKGTIVTIRLAVVTQASNGPNGPATPRDAESAATRPLNV